MKSLILLSVLFSVQGFAKSKKIDIHKECSNASVLHRLDKLQKEWNKIRDKNEKILINDGVKNEQLVWRKIAINTNLLEDKISKEEKLLKSCIKYFPNKTSFYLKSSEVLGSIIKHIYSILNKASISDNETKIKRLTKRVEYLEKKLKK